MCGQQGRLGHHPRAPDVGAGNAPHKVNAPKHELVALEALVLCLWHPADQGAPQGVYRHGPGIMHLCGGIGDEGGWAIVL